MQGVLRSTTSETKMALSKAVCSPTSCAPCVVSGICRQPLHPLQSLHHRWSPRRHLAARAGGNGSARTNGVNGSPSASITSKGLEQLHTACCIIGSGPGGHTAAIYTARAELNPIMFEGFMACDVAPGGQLTMTTLVENFPGWPEGVQGIDLMDNCRAQSVRCGANVFTETVTRVDLSVQPFRVYTDAKEVTADAIIVATGAFARRLHFPGADRLWNRGISACAVCDGPSPCFRDKPLAVIGGGDTAMEYATYLAKYGSEVHVFVLEEEPIASKPMINKAQKNSKVRIHLGVEVLEAKGEEALKSVVVRHLDTGLEEEHDVEGLWFAIGHTPATAFLDGQVRLDKQGYILTSPGSTVTSVPGVFAAGDVQDRKFRQAVTAAGTGCMAAMEVEHFLSYLHHLQAHDPDMDLAEMYYQAAKNAHDWAAPEEDIHRVVYDH